MRFSKEPNLTFRTSAERSHFLEIGNILEEKNSKIRSFTVKMALEIRKQVL